MPEGAERVLRTKVDPESIPETGEVEVELPDGYLTPDEIREGYVPKATIESRINRAVRGRYTIDELVENEDLLTQVAQSAEDRLREFLKIEGEKPDVTKLQETWRQQEVKPLKEQMETMQGEVAKLRQARLSADVSEAAVQLGVKKSHMPLLTPFYKERVAWSDEYGDWFIIGSDGEFEYSASPHEGAPYLTIAEDLDRRARSGDYEDWFDGKGRTGPDYQGGKGDRRNGRLNLDEFKKLPDREKTKLAQTNPQRYRELMAEVTEENRQKLLGG